MRAKPLPPLAYLNECFKLDFNSPSGLVWKKRPLDHCRFTSRWNSRYANTNAGYLSQNKSGTHRYYIVGILKQNYLCHRIVYALSRNVEVPQDREVDHADGNSTNNRPLNLRLAKRSNNAHNSKRSKSNTSNVKGVHLEKRNNTWFGRVSFNGKLYSTGHSPSKAKIEELVRELRQSLHKEFTNHG